MSESTRRFGISYPSHRSTNWYQDFVTCMNQIDSLLFSDFEDKNKVLFGGGSISWSGSALSWTDEIVFVSPTFGQREVLSSEAAPVFVPPGYFLTVSITRGATSGVSL